jgi:hypothetical protein
LYEAKDNETVRSRVVAGRKVLLRERVKAWRPFGAVAILVALWAAPCIGLDPAPVARGPEGGEGSITVTAVGDIMMGTTHPEAVLPPDDGRGIFDRVAGELRGGDVVLGNLEAPLADGCKPEKCKQSKTGRCFAFATPVRYAPLIKRAGFNVMSIANNHAMDCGPPGVRSTITALDSAGIGSAGGDEIAYLDVKGIGVAVLGFSFQSSICAYSIRDISEAADTVSWLKEENDIVIVSFHGGGEGSCARHLPQGDEMFLGENRGDVVKFAHAVVAAGADMVIGHGPHVLRALEIYKGKLIAYSLGNFLTYGMFNVKGPNGVSAILQARLDYLTGDFVGGRIVPVKLTDRGIPEIDRDREAVRLMRELTGERPGGKNLSIGDDGSLKVVAPWAAVP